MSTQRYFSLLKILLAQPGLPTQSAMAQALGTDQPFVSRAAAGELTRITERVKALRRYAGMRARDHRRSRQAVEQSSRVPTAAKGATDALVACRDYLEAGFDPSMLREQVQLLRRAQTAAYRRQSL